MDSPSKELPDIHMEPSRNGIHFSQYERRPRVLSRSLPAHLRKHEQDAHQSTPQQSPKRIDSRIATSSFVPSGKCSSYRSQKCLIDGTDAVKL